MQNTFLFPYFPGYPAIFCRTLIISQPGQPRSSLKSAGLSADDAVDLNPSQGDAIAQDLHRRHLAAQDQHRAADDGDVLA